MIFGFSDSDAAVISAIAGSIAAVIAAGGLFYNAKSFNRLRKAEESREKTEEFRAFDAVYRDIARGMKEYRMLNAESPKAGEEEVHSEKLRVLLSETNADINWLCYLIRHGQIKDKILVRSLKDPIIDWYANFAQERPKDVNNLEVFPDFQILAQQYTLEKQHKKEHGDT